MAMNFQSNVIPPGSYDQGVYNAGPQSLTSGSTNLTQMDQTSRMLVTTQSNKNTFRAGAVGLTLYSGAAAVLLEMQGSATMTVRVKRIYLYTTAAAAVFLAELTLCRATSVGGGTPVPCTPGKMDTSLGAATAVLNSYAAASTAGSGQAVIGAKVLPCITGAATASVQAVTWDFGGVEDTPLVLRGTSQWIEVFNNTTGLTSAKWGFEVEWEEDNS